jgi:hypothetical protein
MVASLPPPLLEADNSGEGTPDAWGAGLAATGRTGLKVAGGTELSLSDGSLTASYLTTKDALRPALASAVAAPQSSVLIVDPNAEETAPNEFRSLSAALEKLKTGGVIELRYTGRLEEPPLKVSKVGNTVNIRAAKGYEPVVVFRPRTADDPPHMISVRDAQLRLMDVALELVSPPLASHGWSLVSLVRSSIEFKRCTLTSTWQSDFSDKVCFFRIDGESPSGAMMMAMAVPGLDASSSIRLEDSVVRGGGEMVRAKAPVRISWTNGLAVLSDALFVSEIAMPPRDDRSSIELRYVTARLGGGLCSIAGSPLQETSINCRDCLLVGDGGTPLIQQQGSDTPTNLKSHLTWTGERNLYEGLQTFWKISGEQDRQQAQESMDQSDWQGHWNNGELPATHDRDRPLGWVTRLEENTRPWHEHVPRDYALSPLSQASRKADDAGDIGFRLKELPNPPPARSAPRP